MGFKTAIWGGWVVGLSLLAGCAGTPPPREATLAEMERALGRLQDQGPGQWAMERQSDEALPEKDAWGTPLRSWIDQRGGHGAGPVGRLVVESAGPDRRFGTTDDIVRHGNFRPLDE